MATTRPSGIYQRLLRELSDYNRGLPKSQQLSLAARYKLLSQSIYPKYQGMRMYQFRVTSARKTIQSAVKRSRTKKSARAPTVYHRLLHELSEYNKTLPEEKQLSAQDRYKLLSESIYPRYQGTRMYQFRVLKARKRIKSAVKSYLEKVGGDVIGIPQDVYQNILYWELDDHLNKDKNGTLSHGFNIKVSAGEHGETGIFNTANFNYYDLGLDDITNDINNTRRARTSNQNTDTYPFYIGKVQVIPGRENDNKAENYFLHLVLVEDGVMAEDVEDIEIPKRTGRRAKKKEKKTKKLVKESERQVQVEKSRAKRVRNSVEKEIQDTALILSKRFFSKQILSDYKADRQQRELKRIERYYKNGTINQTQYERLVKRIKEAYK